ncbi:unnamed protein product [Calypogeia fissa]
MLVASNRLSAYSVHMMVVPERLIGVAQPLDVGLNRGFQSSYGAKYDEYIAKALDDRSMQTNTGNVKVPNYHEVAEWVLEWMASVPRSVQRETVQKSFISCGLLQEHFDMDALHMPLRELLSGEYRVESWAARHSELLEADDLSSQTSYSPPKWHLPETTVTSLFTSILVKLHLETLAARVPNSGEVSRYRDDLIAHMKLQRDLQDITNIMS